MTDSWIKAAAGVVHQGTSVIGGTFDASAITGMSGTEQAVIGFASVTSCPNTRIENNRVINAPVHGIFISESTYTPEKKWVQSNSIEEHGNVAIGYGIYADFIGNTEINANFVSNTHGYDCIELGHSGYATLGINANLRATNNSLVIVVLGGMPGVPGFPMRGCERLREVRFIMTPLLYPIYSPESNCCYGYR